MRTLTHNQRGGFTLIEVLVSLSIFTVVVTICVSTLYALIEANSRSRNAQSIATNLSFTIDSMTREIRTGGDFYCASNSTSLPYAAGSTDTQDCVSGGSAFSFNEGGQSLTGTLIDNRRIGYRLESGKLQRRLGNESWQDLTSDDVTIETLQFYVEGTDRLYDGSSDTLAPLVTVFLKGVVGDEESQRQEFSIQTTITQRLLDI